MKELRLRSENPLWQGTPRKRLIGIDADPSSLMRCNSLYLAVS